MSEGFEQNLRYFLDQWPAVGKLCTESCSDALSTYSRTWFPEARWCAGQKMSFLQEHRHKDCW